jgi:hypothetical protein
MLGYARQVRATPPSRTLAALAHSDPALLRRALLNEAGSGSAGRDLLADAIECAEDEAAAHSLIRSWCSARPSNRKSATAGPAGARSAGSHLSGLGRSKPRVPATSEPLYERSATCSSIDRVTVRREVAGHDVGSRDGDSNPGPAHYE